jgi:hypothetical protein
MSDHRREQIAAAAEVFERVLRGYEDAPSDRSRNGHPPRAERVQMAQLKTAAARTMDLYSQLVQEALEAAIHLAEDLVPSLGAGGEAPLTLAGRPGATVATPVWIHNVTDARVSGVRLRMTDLSAPTGGSIVGALAGFEPDELAIEPGASGETLLSLRIPHDATPAVYHGHLLAGALPAAALAVRLEVDV